MVGLPYEVSPLFLCPSLLTSLYFSFTIDFVETTSLVLCVNNFSPTRLLAVFTVHCLLLFNFYVLQHIFVKSLNNVKNPCFMLLLKISVLRNVL